MTLSTGARLPLFRHVVANSLAILALMTICEWLITTWLPQEKLPLGSILRVLLATSAVGVISYLLYRKQQHHTSQLMAQLAHSESVNQEYQQQLSEHEATERALSNQLQFLQVLIDAIPAPIFYKDAEGIYSGCNRAFEAFLGKPREEIVGRSVYGVSPGPQARVYHEKDMELMHQRGHQVYESSVVYADGTLHDVIFNKAAYETKDGQLGGLIGVILDITERKALERELVQAKERAEFFSRSKTQFLTNMSHEIRTPLNAIVGFSQVLLNRSGTIELPHDFRDFLEKITISGQGLAILVNDVLDISRIEAGKIEAVDEDFNLRRMLKSILVSCEPQAFAKKIKFNCDIDPRLPDFIRMDRGKLSQILINLIGNAIKFSPTDTVVELKFHKLENNQFRLDVMDYGIGIPPEQQAIVFEPFEQVDKSHDGQSRGTGLGLPIARSLVELLGGKIGLESTKNTGTRFTVILPLQQGASDDHFSVDNSDSLSTGTVRKGLKILIFEDNAVNQALMQAFCDDLGAHASFVTDGHTGLQKALQIQPDIIFMDIQLPGLDGIEATQKIRQMRQICNIPVIGLSAAAFTEQKNAALSAGMNDYLAKPVAFPQLISAINKNLNFPRPVCFQRS
ncbi:ATP-binding protein [Microbulbifer aggregans]|uniref:ATP-binding protein n=1 Tax=Microbulbifer aggregans TaxID=1769779 RepID=UPI001CFF50DC|nr:ATP-binding protein [Microbulbifer aggregans]